VDVTAQVVLVATGNYAAAKAIGLGKDLLTSSESTASEEQSSSGTSELEHLDDKCIS
jgi:hypothetical protein